MAINSTMGLKKIYVAPVGENGAMPSTGWLDLGDVYQESCTLKDSDPETTVFKSETSSKKITVVGEIDTTVELTLMDPDLAQLSRYFGGEVSGSGTNRTWTRPKKLDYVEWAVWIQPIDGLFVGCPVARIIPKLEISYNSKGICLMPMTIEFQADLQVAEGMTAPTISE